MTRRGTRNNRGVALLITLLVTALLIALIFEFAYGTRVSLRAAVNFRDSQRAYFLARSGVYAFAKFDGLKDSIPQGEWGVIPFISTGDVEVRVKWEDEKGKINIKGQLGDVDTYGWLSELFSNRGVNQKVLDRLVEEKKQIQILTELHQIMSDEEFGKVSGYLTVSLSGKAVNVNTAPEEVLQSMGINNPSIIVARRIENPFKPGDAIPGAAGVQTRSGQNVTNFLDTTGTIYKVYSYATVGGYTKQIEAIIYKNSSQVLYWRAL